MTVHPLVWAIQLWVVATATSLLLAVGLSGALRGAYVGAESIISKVDHAAALTSQVAALATTLLLIYAGFMSARAAKSFSLGVGAAVLGAVPTLMVFYAHRFAMPQIYTWFSAVCAASVLVLCATQIRTKSAVRSLIAFGGLALASATLRTFPLGETESPVLVQIGATLQVFFSWCIVVSAIAFHLLTPTPKALRASILIGVTVLLAATAAAAAEPGASPWVLLTGRALFELTETGVMGKSGSLAFSGTLTALLSALLSRQGSLTQVICALLALCVVSPLSPLTIATMTLCGYFAVIVCWVPDTAMKSSSDTAHI